MYADRQTTQNNTFGSESAVCILADNYVWRTRHDNSARTAYLKQLLAGKLKKEARAVGVVTKSSHFASSADLGGAGGGGVYLQRSQNGWSEHPCSRQPSSQSCVNANSSGMRSFWLMCLKTSAGKTAECNRVDQGWQTSTSGTRLRVAGLRTYIARGGGIELTGTSLFTNSKLR